MSVYINSTGFFLPGDPIDNEQIEQHLGLVNNKPSRLKNKILKANGIKTRHYAIDKNHNTLFNNDQLAAKAAQNCLEKSFIDKNDIQMLSVASTQGDLMLPGLASMVQAQMDLEDVEISTSHGICSSSLMALKNAYMQIKCNEHQNAMVIASEFSSRLFKASKYEAVDSSSVDFNAEFLRWMLSDGAGALLLENQPRGEHSFKIDWIRSFSHADSYPVCMSVGNSIQKDDNRNWQDFENCALAEKSGAFLIRQDVRLLENIVKLGVDGYLRLIEQNYIDPNQIDHVLCHYSSHHFKSKIQEMMEKAGVAIDESKWYSNLYTRGNTGCASIFIMLDEFRKTQNFSSGQKILCMVPESGRFNNAYMQLTVV